jgi:hypothetical protein
MPIWKYSLAPLPERRVHGRASPALAYLQVAHTTLQGIFESLHVVREAAGASRRDARGRLREGEVDLLRSALVLAGAGLDVVLKRLARDALPELLAVGSTQAAAGRKFKNHVRAQIENKTPPLWLQAILDPDPRQAMIRLYVKERTQASLLSKENLLAIRDALGIDKNVLPDERIYRLAAFLTARNRVAHDLDIKAPEDPSPGTRYSRQINLVANQCDLVLGLADAFIVAVSDELGGPPLQRQ